MERHQEIEQESPRHGDLNVNVVYRSAKREFNYDPSSIAIAAVAVGTLGVLVYDFLTG